MGIATFLSNRNCSLHSSVPLRSDPTAQRDTPSPKSRHELEEKHCDVGSPCVSTGAFARLWFVGRNLVIRSVVSKLFTPKQTAQELHVSPDTLAAWRCRGAYGLPFVKIGSKVFYKQSDIEEFIRRRTVGSTVRSPVRKKP